MHRGPHTTAGNRADLFLIAVVSAAILAYELLLTRILAVRFGSYFAAMIVSLAMLGFAASGTALFLCSRSKRGAAGSVPWVTACFAVSVPLGPRLAERIHCVPLVVLWNGPQFGLFAANYLVLSLPLFLGGFLIGSFFLQRELPAGRVYFGSMLGSGAGVLLALTLLCSLRPSWALGLTALAVIGAAAPRARSPGHRLALAGAALMAGLTGMRAPGRPALSEYKEMSNLLRMPDARIEHSDWNRFGYLSVVDSRGIRYAPGLSLTFTGPLPEQKGIFINGDDMEAVCSGADEPALRAFFDAMLSGVAYRFHDRPRVVVLGAGGGMEVLRAVVSGAARVDAVENNAGISRLMTGPLSDFTGGPYRRKSVRLIPEGARAYASRTGDRYDVAVLPGKRSLFASAAGTSAQDPDYLLTTEALWDFFSILAPGGVLVVETWLNLPPRDSAKLLALAAQSLRTRGLDPAPRLMAARSLRTGLLLVFRDPVTTAQISVLTRFCAERSFDLVYHPSIRSEEVNRFNRVAGAPYYSSCMAILREPDETFRRHLYAIRPPTDDRPYFSHFFKWAALPQLLNRTGRNVAAYVGWDYVFLLITLVQAVPLGAMLILLPLCLLRDRSASGQPGRWRMYVYFPALGSGFMFVEFAAIQQFARFLPHPVYAFGVAVGGILLFSGLGSLTSGHRAVRTGPLFGMIVALVLTHLVLWRLSMRLCSPAWFGLDLSAIALLAFFMGMPFPRGIERLRASAPGRVPWAWGLNGFASVMAVLAAGLVSLSWGLSAVVGLAAMSYGVAAFTFPADQ